MAKRRNASASTARSPAGSAAAIAASYRSIASAMQPARSCSRAAPSASPGDGIIGKMSELTRDLVCEEVVYRRQQLQDGQGVAGIGEPLGHELRERAAVGVAHGERRRLGEGESLGRELDAVDGVGGRNR